jgi:hypothetical protein
LCLGTRSTHTELADALWPIYSRTDACDEKEQVFLQPVLIITQPRSVVYGRSENLRFDLIGLQFLSSAYTLPQVTLTTS